MEEMIIKSQNGKYYYFLITNPFKQIGRMQSKLNCKECTHFSVEWDKLEHRYNNYCNLFGVWQDDKKPNNICLNFRNENSFLFSPPEPVIHNGGVTESEKRIVNE